MPLLQACAAGSVTEQQSGCQIMDSLAQPCSLCCPVPKDGAAKGVTLLFYTLGRSRQARKPKAQKSLPISRLSVSPNRDCRNIPNSGKRLGPLLTYLFPSHPGTSLKPSHTGLGAPLPRRHNQPRRGFFTERSVAPWRGIHKLFQGTGLDAFRQPRCSQLFYLNSDARSLSRLYPGYPWLNLGYHTHTHTRTYIGALAYERGFG